jgi:hypothetical protein
MSILGDNGRNRIAAPTHGHEWRAGAPFWANRNRLHHPSGAGTRFITHEGHTLKGTRQVVMGRDRNSIASAREHSTSWAPLMARRKKMTCTSSSPNP